MPATAKSSTPSPRSAASRNRSYSTSDASSVSLQPGLLSSRTSKASRSDTPSPGADSTSDSLSNVSHVSDTDLESSRETRNSAKKKGIPKPKLKTCPCGNSSGGKEWVFKCTDCKQAWHASCANLKGSLKLKNQAAADAINMSWLCPWCFVCPYQRPSKHPSAQNQQTLLDASFNCAVTQQLTDSIMEVVKKSVPTVDISGIQSSLDELGRNLNEMKSQKIGHTTTDGIPDQPPFYPEEPIQTPQVPARRPLTSPDPPYSHYSANFLEETELSDVNNFLNELKSTGKFKRENGHSTVLLGRAYSYTGSKTPTQPEPIPAVLKKVIEKLEEKLSIKTSLNSVLINHFEATEDEDSPQSFIALHSDDEPVILADSSIVTLSVGGKRTLSFQQIHQDGDEVENLEVANNSVYTMTRKSQGWFRHGILPSPVQTAERFSLTLRSVSEKFRRSLVILGDSNTKEIKFGEGPGRVGESYPGKRVKAAKVSNIDVNECVGYSNIFLCCGTNDLREQYVKSSADIHNTVNELKTKLEIIEQLCPKAKVFVSPVLPSRLPRMNQNIMTFNNLVESMLQQYLPNTWFASVSSFLDNQGLLSTKLTRGNDTIHLGPRGIAKFVSHIKYCVFTRETRERKDSVRDLIGPTYNSSQESTSTVVGTTYP